MRSIRIDGHDAATGEPDGTWVMNQVGGVFTHGWDHALLNVDGQGARLGGFALCHYLGASMTVHMAGVDARWCSRDLLWMVFHYAFVQLGLRKLIAPVHSTNHIAMAQDLRAGWTVEAVLRDATPDGHLVLLTMTRDTCPWLKLRPKGYKASEPAQTGGFAISASSARGNE